MHLNYLHVLGDFFSYLMNIYKVLGLMHSMLISALGLITNFSISEIPLPAHFEALLKSGEWQSVKSASKSTVRSIAAEKR